MGLKDQLTEIVFQFKRFCFRIKNGPDERKHFVFKNMFCVLLKIQCVSFHFFFKVVDWI